MSKDKIVSSLEDINKGRMTSETWASRAAKKLELPITPAMMPVLGTLATEDEQLNIGDLAFRMGISQQAMGKMLRILATHELVELTESQEDRRERQIKITKLGRRAATS